jgi:hypothetical protein
MLILELGCFYSSLDAFNRAYSNACYLWCDSNRTFVVRCFWLMLWQLSLCIDANQADCALAMCCLPLHLLFGRPGGFDRGG